MKVTLRQRKNTNGISLYLDVYDNGIRTYEYLDFGLILPPEKGRLTKEENQKNRDNLALAESIKAKRQLQIQNGIYGFQDLTKMKGSFINYMEGLAEIRNTSRGNYGSWDSAIKHVKIFAKGDVSFNQVDKKWLQNLKDYFQKDAKTSAKKSLSQNTQSSYYIKVKAALNQAFKDGVIPKNPGHLIDGIKAEETERQFLTLDELQAMVDTDCENPMLKSAFLFSALTGLRWSDINKLVWSEVQHSKEIGYYIRFKQQKTKGAETQPISDQAVDLLGERGNPEERVFTGLKYSAWHNLKLQQWVMRAGITKTITFHCARHTYATLQLTFGTDIYTVSKLLGHKNLKTTQIYAKIIDEKKKEAANRIQLKF